MADRHDYTPSGRRGAAPTAGGNRPEEDPLVELARIVSGRSAVGDTSRRRSALTAPPPVEADLARDLEAELLSDLQASFAASRYDDPAPAATTYDETTYDTPDYEAPDYEAPRTEPAYSPLAFVRDDYDGGTSYAGTGYGDGQDDPARYQDQSDYHPYGRAGDDEQAYEAPVEDDGADYGGLTLRGTTEDEPEADYAGQSYEDEGYSEPEAYETEEYEAPEPDEPRPYPIALQRPVAVAAVPSSYSFGRDDDAPVHPVPALADYGRADDEYGAYPALGRGEPTDDPGYDDDRPVAPAYAEEAGGRRFGKVRPRREVMAIAGVLAVILVGGATALVLRGGTGGGETAAPVFLAEATPTKIAPEAEAVDVAAVDPTKLIYDRVGAGEGLDPDAEGPQALLPLDDEPIADVPSLAPAANEGSREISRIILPGAPGDPALDDPATADAANSDAAAAGEPATRDFEPPAAEAAASPGPRRVRTVVVRPDGTIVSNDARPAAGEAAAPAATLGEAAALPGGLEPTRTEGDGAREAVAADEPRPRRNPERTEADAGQQPAGETVVAAAEPAPAVTVRRVPVERQTARGEPMSLLPDTPQAPAANAGGGGFIVQVASQRSEAEAISAYRGLQQRLPQLLSGREPDIKRADLGDRGTFFRVRVAPAGTRDEANRLCASLKAAGADCIVAQN